MTPPFSHFAPLVRVSLAAVVASFALPACSSSSTSAPADAGSLDTQFCDAVIANSNRCGDAGACSNAALAELAQNCTQAASVDSTALKSAYVACGASLSCVPFDGISPFNVLTTSCGQSAARGALSAAQEKLASDYCAVCGGLTGLSTSGCESAFWGLEADSGTILGGIGYGALSYSDAIVGLVDTSCIPDLDAGSLTGCMDPFAACIGATTAAALTSALPSPAACAQANGDGGVGAF